MSLPKSFRMNTASGGVDVPSVGFGTWQAGETGWCKSAVLTALQIGYRHLDCAWDYGVDEEVGEAIRESGVPREDIFITTKFWPQFASPHNVGKCLEMVLQNMKLSYIDLYLVHWPVAIHPRDNIDSARAFPGATPQDLAIATDENGKDLIDVEHSPASIAASRGAKGSFIPTWNALKELVESGKCRALGVSNFAIAQLEEILPHSKDIPISANQIEFHPWLPNDRILAYMKANDILPLAYSPFAPNKIEITNNSGAIGISYVPFAPRGTRLLEEPIVKDVAKRNGMGEGQVLQSWAVMRGTIPLGKSQTPERIRSNLAVKRLSVEDFEALNSLKMDGDEGRTTTVFNELWGIKLYGD